MSLVPPSTQYTIPPFQIVPVVAPMGSQPHIIHVTNQQSLFAAPESGSYFSPDLTDGRRLKEGGDSSSRVRERWLETVRGVQGQGELLSTKECQNIRDISSCRNGDHVIRLEANSCEGTNEAKASPTEAKASLTEVKASLAEFGNSRRRSDPPSLTAQKTSKDHIASDCRLSRCQSESNVMKRCSDTSTDNC